MLFIYSGDVPELDEILAQWLGSERKLTVIPTSINDHTTARHIAGYYKNTNINACTLPKRAYNDSRLLKSIILDSDAVFLCGGNTYEFLDFANNLDLFTTLSIFEANNGIIAAESAGSIILTSNIATASIPSSYPDENLVGITDLTAMNRLTFHISPHYDPMDEFCSSDRLELQTLANESGQSVMLLEDGEGFIVEGDRITHFQGKEKYLNPVGTGSVTKAGYQPQIA